MKLSEHLGVGQVLLEQHVGNKWELVDRMIEALRPVLDMPADDGDPVKLVREAIERRERQLATRMGDGVGLPHARIVGLGKCVMCLATVDGGIDFENHSKEPVNIVCMLLIPENNPGIGLQIMAGMAELLRDPVVRKYLHSTRSAEKAHEFLCRQNVSLEGPVRAVDIMRGDDLLLSAGLPIRQVVDQMHERHMEAAAVLDASGRVVGEVNCDQLFRKGIPDFFNQLASVAFIRDFDPFEKYFAQEAGMTAGDVMTTDFAAVAEDATLIEIIFLLTVKHYKRVYVVRAGVWVGVIDRSTVLDRILNL
jgi:mannitol/fructose-specific phosphotransferase system IIA component (Ntr-type)/predicted transcriptional regulator